MDLDRWHLSYYEKELYLLRQGGKAFAKLYPKIAARLSLAEGVSQDPHTERLLESFAYLTSYLKKDIDDQFPRLSSTLLEVLYPQLVAPIPPMSIAKLVLDPKKGKSTTGYSVPRHTELYAQSQEGIPCRFRTAYDLTLWPLEIIDVDIMRRDLFDVGAVLTSYPFCLKIVLRTTAIPLNQLQISCLQFYLHGDPMVYNTLYEYLFLAQQPYAIQGQDQPARIIPSGSLHQVGFGDNENVLPDFPQTFSGYRLLQEYYAFPQKFLFFNLTNLDFSQCHNTAEIIIPLATQDENTASKLPISIDNIQLGCTPIINLFSKTTDPIVFDKKSIEYPLFADVRRQLSLEIHSIEKVVRAVPNTPIVEEISPYFSYNHPAIDNKKTYYWMQRRVPAPQGIPGTQILMSFVDLDFNAETPTDEVIYAKTLCTNRSLATFVRPFTVLQATQSLPVTTITTLLHATPSAYGFQDGAAQWKLISQLSLNYLSLGGNDACLQALNEILTLYKGSIEMAMPVDMAEIIKMETENVVCHRGRDAWRGMMQGTGVCLTFAQLNFDRRDVMLFSSVLSHFLNLYAGINSFVQLSVKKPGQLEVWKTWDPVCGAQKIL